MSLVPRPRFWSMLVSALILYMTFSFVDVWWASRASSDHAASAAIVLGAAQYNGEPSPVLQRRLDTAAQLYLQDTVQFVVVTGGGQAGDVTTEAKASYDYLREVAGIPDERLLLEVQGTSTYESLAAASRFLLDENLTGGSISDVLVVTDPYHARRAELIAREVGLKADAVVTESGAPFGRLFREAGAVAIGRVISFRRLDRFVS